MTPRRYSYVGPAAVRERAAGEPDGTVITSREVLRGYLARDHDACTEGATFVVDDAGRLRLAPRRSEHVACAGGGEVFAAGELVFDRASCAVLDASNQSTGYCPEPDSFAALAAALDALGVARPADYTFACTFRRCPACAQLGLVKDACFECACCGAELPRAWNCAR